MARISVFYAWQSDLPDDVARNFIREAAEAAIKQLGVDLPLEDSPRLDHDTQGVAGIPGIGDTIMRKIEECAVFIADVSLVGETIDKARGRKLIPNPNVLIELGYAWGRADWRRLILVMNSRHGGPSKLPFDLRHRRFPYVYRIREDRADLREESEKLTVFFVDAIKAVLNEDHQKVTEIIRRLDGYSLHLIHKHSCSTFIWETEPSKNSFAARHDIALVRLVDLGMLESVPYEGSPTGYAYRWSYFGRLVMQRLALPGPPQPPSAPSVPYSAGFIDLSMYDELLDRAESSDDKGNVF